MHPRRRSRPSMLLRSRGRRAARGASRVRCCACLRHGLLSRPPRVDGSHMDAGSLDARLPSPARRALVGARPEGSSSGRRPRRCRRPRRAARVALDDVRRALAAMASPGQAAVGWSRRAAAAIEERATAVDALACHGPAGRRRRGRATATSSTGSAKPSGGSAITPSAGKALMATDVAFGEAMPHVDELERRVGDGATAATVAAEDGMAVLRDRQVMALAGALGGLLLTALTLTPLPQGSDRRGPRASRPPMPRRDAAPVPTSCRWQPGPGGHGQSSPRRTASTWIALDRRVRRPGAAQPRQLPPVGSSASRRFWAPAASSSGSPTPTAGSSTPAASPATTPRLLERLGPVDVADDNPTAQAFSSGPADGHAAGAGRAAAAVGAHRRGERRVRRAVGGAAGRDAAGVGRAAAATIGAAQLAMLIGPAAQPPVDDEPERRRHRARRLSPTIPGTAARRRHCRTDAPRLTVPAAPTIATSREIAGRRGAAASTALRLDSSSSTPLVADDVERHLARRRPRAFVHQLARRRGRRCRSPR